MGDPRRSVRAVTRKRRALVGGVLLVVCVLGAFGLVGSESSNASTEREAGKTRPVAVAVRAAIAGSARRGERPRSVALSRPAEMHLQGAHGAVFDVRKLNAERPVGEAGRASADPPAPDASFDGLDFANWGSGIRRRERRCRPELLRADDQLVDRHLRQGDRRSCGRVHVRPVHEPGPFREPVRYGNAGDPTVLYDTFEDRWLVTDHAYRLDSGGNVNPQQVFQCLAVSKTGDPVTGGWNFYSIQVQGGVDASPRVRVWPDGIYMSASMTGYPLTQPRSVRTCGRSTRRRCTPASRASRCSTSRDPGASSCCFRPTPGSRPARRRRVPPRTSSRPGSS